MEDFLTEALADLLTRMPSGKVSELLEHAFEDSLPSYVLSILATCELDWRTQVPVTGGIVDLVLFANAKPVIVFENKTWSGFQDHSTDKIEANQLTTYCRWLAEHAAHKDACAVLLLTGTTSSPDRFHDANGRYAVACRSQITWAALGRWLANKVSPTGTQGIAVWEELSNDLIYFLKEKNLTSEIYTASDVSAAHLFLPTMERWGATFRTIWDSAEPKWRSFLSGRIQPLVFESEAGMVWQWHYTKPKAAPIKTWVGLGLRFPDQSQWYDDIGLPKEPHFLFIVGTDRGTLRHDGKLPAGWLRNTEDEEFILAQPVSELSSSVDTRIEQLGAWSKRAMVDCKSILIGCSAD